MLSLGKLRFSEDDGKRTRSHTAAAEDAHQRAGIDPARKKNTDGNVANELHPYSFLEHGLNLTRCTGLVVARGSLFTQSRGIIDQIPVLGELQCSIFPYEKVPSR